MAVMSDDVATAHGCSAGRRSGLPRVVGVFALVLAASSALPLTPAGQSFVGLLLGEFGRGFLPGLLMLIGFGSPYVFGLAVAAVTFVVWPVLLAQRSLQIPVALLHAQLCLVALVVWRSGDVLGGPALLGFAVVGGLAFVVHSARTYAEADGPSIAWLVRWGALMISGVALWAKLQRFAEIPFRIGLDVACAAAVSITVAMGRQSFRAAMRHPKVPP